MTYPVSRTVLYEMTRSVASVTNVIEWDLFVCVSLVVPLVAENNNHYYLKLTPMLERRINCNSLRQN